MSVNNTGKNPHRNIHQSENSNYENEKSHSKVLRVTTSMVLRTNYIELVSIWQKCMYVKECVRARKVNMLLKNIGHNPFIIRHLLYFSFPLDEFLVYKLCVCVFFSVTRNTYITSYIFSLLFHLLVVCFLFVLFFCLFVCFFL